MSPVPNVASKYRFNCIVNFDLLIVYFQILHVLIIKFQEYLVGKSASNYIGAYHSLHHFKYNLYKRCLAKVCCHYHYKLIKRAIDVTCVLFIQVKLTKIFYTGIFPYIHDLI